MKTKPILFSTPMVQAILAGHKTQTRRLVKGVALDWLGNAGFTPQFVALPENHTCPYGNVGDVLWVRETFTEEACATAVCYKADFPIVWPAEQTEDGIEIRQEAKHYKFKPSIFMPRAASRLTLEITGVRVESLQDISRGDCMGEGCPFPNIARETDPVAWYKELWEKLNGKESWAADPWVWVLDFKVHKENIDLFVNARKS